MVFRSTTTEVHGDEPGRGGGVVSGTCGGICEPIEHADQVFAEGSPVIRHLDKFHMNNRNTQGEAIFVRDMGVYRAPVDDDPMPGSLFSGQTVFVEGAEYQVAQAFTGTMNDATMGGGETQERTRTAPNTNRRGRFGQPWYLALLNSLTGGAVSEAQIATELSELDYYANTPDKGLTLDQMAVLGQAAQIIRADALPAGDLDMAKDIKDRAWEIVGAEPSAFQGLTEEEIEGILKGQITLEEALNRDPDEDPEEDPNPRPIPPPPLGTGTRVDEDEDQRPRCMFETICFMPVSPTVDREEFRRQLKLQEGALNGMTPTQMLGNRGAYLADPEGMRRRSEPLQRRTRQEYRASLEEDYEDLYGPNAEAELDAYMATRAALHNPDMIAGGAYTSVSDPSIPLENRIGGLNENSSMGSQWRGGRSQRLANHAREQQRNNCPSVQVILEVCPSVRGSAGTPVGANGAH